MGTVGRRTPQNKRRNSQRTLICLVTLCTICESADSFPSEPSSSSMTCLLLCVLTEKNIRCSTDGLAYVPLSIPHSCARSLRSHDRLQHGSVILFIAPHRRDDDARLLRTRNPARDCRLLDPRAQRIHEEASHAVAIFDRHRRLCTSFHSLHPLCGTVGCRVLHGAHACAADASKLLTSSNVG